jgi:hypothetical protein
MNQQLDPNSKGPSNQMMNRRGETSIVE